MGQGGIFARRGAASPGFRWWGINFAVAAQAAFFVGSTQRKSQPWARNGRQRARRWSPMPRAGFLGSWSRKSSLPHARGAPGILIQRPDFFASRHVWAREIRLDDVGTGGLR